MPSESSLLKPVETIRVDMASTAITTAAWLQISAALHLGACAMEVFNPSGSTMIMSQGPIGSEDAAVNLFPWTIIPGGTTGLVPLESHAGKPLSLKAVDADASLGILVVNIYG